MNAIPNVVAQFIGQMCLMNQATTSACCDGAKYRRVFKNVVAQFIGQMHFQTSAHYIN